MARLRYILNLIILITGCSLIARIATAQQLKLGNNPTQIEKSAVLELESANQGLLLTRVTDTQSINTNAPPDGMIIYFVNAANPGLYIREGGWWHELITKDGDGIVSLNGDKTKNQTLTLSSEATSPLGFLTPVNGAQVLNIPMASYDKTGLITTQDQIINGVKTLLKSPKIDELTEGSVLFIGAGKSISENNGNLYWDNTNNRLGIGLGSGTTPGNTLEINSSIAGKSGIRFTQLNSSSPIDQTGSAIGVNANGDVVKVPGIQRTTAVLSDSYSAPLLGLKTMVQKTETIPITGATVGSSVIVSPRSGLLSGMWLANARVNTAGQVTIDVFINTDLLGAVLGHSYPYSLTLDIALIQ